MNLYEFVTPSDAITFKAINDKVAYMVAILMGNGKAGCNKEGGESIPTMLMFDPTPEKTIDEYLGMQGSKFVKDNNDNIADSLLSFAYGTFASREVFDKAFAACASDEDRDKFLKKHETKNRTSMSQWVKAAWDAGKKIKAKKE